MGPGKRWSWRFLIFSTHWALQGEKRELFCLLTQKSFTESHFCQFSFMGRASRARICLRRENTGTFGTLRARSFIKATCQRLFWGFFTGTLPGRYRDVGEGSKERKELFSSLREKKQRSSFFPFGRAKSLSSSKGVVRSGFRGETLVKFERELRYQIVKLLKVSFCKACQRL